MKPESLLKAREYMMQPGMTHFSFDVFDTFILRRTTGYDGVYERTYHNATLPTDKRDMAECFVQHRALAESKARLAQKKLNGSQEVTIDQVYRDFPMRVFGLPKSAYAELAEAEFQAELDVCHVNREIFELLKEARGMGLKVGFLSDTYWSKIQLDKLLRHVAPDLEYDFLLPSSEYGVGKSHGMFDIYLKEQGVDPRKAVHIGDNFHADVKMPLALGLFPIYYPQANAYLISMIQRERDIVAMMQAQRGGLNRRVDDCLTMIRRRVTAKVQEKKAFDHFIGKAVFGPVMMGFQRFLDVRIPEIQAESRKSEILFLARDGFLPHNIWQRAGRQPAHYVEINRRIAIIGATAEMSALQKFFEALPLINHHFAENVLKVKLPEAKEFFAATPTGFATGKAFAEALPDIISLEMLQELSSGMRKELLTYLRRLIPNFDEATDLILVDVGYTGSIQRALRTIFDLEGMPDKRLHGLYILTIDHAFNDLAEQDSAQGFIDDTILPPLAKRGLLRNVGLLEQCCSASVGTVLSYENGKVVHEEDNRPESQLAFCAQLQNACVDFYSEAEEAIADIGIDPFANLLLAQQWAAAILMRLMVLPSHEELQIFGGMKQDVNLGTKVLVEMIDAAGTEGLMGTFDFRRMMNLKEPPMWLSGSLISVFPAAGALYAVSSFGLLDGDSLNDKFVGKFDAAVIKDGAGTPVEAEFLLTPFGDLRVRVAIPKEHTGSMLALPLEQLVPHGVLRSQTLQRGDTPLGTLDSRIINQLKDAVPNGINVEKHGLYFKAQSDDANLLFDVPYSDYEIAIVHLLITPLPG